MQKVVLLNKNKEFDNGIVNIAMPDLNKMNISELRLFAENKGIYLKSKTKKRIIDEINYSLKR